MPKKSTFTDEQLEMIWDAAERVYNKKFRKSKKAQVNFGLALGLSQQSVSKLLNRNPDYRPGPEYVLNLAMLDGKDSIEGLVGKYEKPEKIKRLATSSLRNLEATIVFHEEEKRWSPWTIAAARAKYFGEKDLSPAKWVEKLDELEKRLGHERAS